MRVLLLNQAFHPDVVSTAQHAADLAGRLSDSGHEVTVLCSRRAYDEPSRRFPACETWRNIRIIRLWCTGFGKRTALGRICDFVSFLASCFLRLLFLRRFDVVVAMTSPPLLSFVAAVF